MKTYLILGGSLVALTLQSGCAMNLHSPNFGANGTAPAADGPPTPGLSHPGLRDPGLVIDVSDHALIAELR